MLLLIEQVRGKQKFVHTDAMFLCFHVDLNYVGLC
jgi:hypothetical protein